MNNAMAHRNGWNQQAQILECAYTSFFYDIKLEPSGIIQMHWNCINSIKVKQFKECKIVIGYDDRVLDHWLLLKAGLLAAPREGGSVCCPCIISTWKASCGPGRRHRDHPVQIQRWSMQWSSLLRQQPCTRWLQSQCWQRLPYVLFVNSWALGWSRDMWMKNCVSSHK